MFNTDDQHGLDLIETSFPAQNPRAPIRILLADDHQNVRMQVRARLLREPDFEIVAEAINSSEVLERALLAKPQIVLIDPMMRDGLGVQSVQRLATCIPEVAIVVLIAVADTALQMELRRMGARQILNKGLASAQLVTTLREIGRTVLK